MHIFLIAAVPTSFVYALILRDEAGEPSSLVAVSALRGAFAYLVELAVLLLINRFLPRVHSGIASYFYSALYDFGIPIIGTFLLYLWFTPAQRGLAGRERRIALQSFLAGAFTLAGIMDLFLRAEYFGVFELFLLPGLRVAAMLVVPLLYRLFAEETFWTRVLYLVALAALPFAFAAIWFLLLLSYPLPAILAASAMFAGAWVVTILGGMRSHARRGFG